MAVTISKSTKLIVDFVVHVVVGAFGFFVVFAAAVALTAFTVFVEERSLAPHNTLFLMHHLEDAILIIDIVGFGAILLAELYKLLAKVLDSVRPVQPTVAAAPAPPAAPPPPIAALGGNARS